MPNTIQLEEYSMGSGTDDILYIGSEPRRQPQRSVSLRERRQGCDELELARQRLEQRQPRASLRNSLHFSPRTSGAEFCFVNCPFHPPSIFPTSSSGVERAIYFFVSFERYLMQNVLKLHSELATNIYQHGGYEHFKISDPKPRDIHKASVRDRLVHHALYRKLYPFFDRTFIADSYSCRNGKGTHKAMNRFRDFAYKVSKNHTRTVWILKCDIRKFFASIDQRALMEIKRI